MIRQNEDFITIVSGLPRSGTSMMMRMLEAGGIPVLTDNIRKADEDNPRGYYEFEAVKRSKTDTSWIDHARGTAVKMVYRLLYNMPSAYNFRVIFMERKLEEVIASQEAMLGRKRQPLSPAFDPERLANVFRSELKELYAWLRNQPNFTVLVVDYGKVLSNPEENVARIDKFMGPGLNTGEMVGVVEPSLYRQRR